MQITENESPLTLALFPQGRAEGIGGVLRASDTAIGNPSFDADEEPAKPGRGDMKDRCKEPQCLLV